MCRAAVIAAYNKPYEIREFPIPEIEPGAILVKIDMAGICGTDVHQVAGELGIKPKLPVIPGHEAIGKIVKMGRGRTRDCAGAPLAAGDRIMWAHVSCGECRPCKVDNQPNLCVNRFSYGMSYSGAYPYLSGGFAEYAYILPRADVVKVPEQLSNEEVIGVCCAFRTAVSAFERLEGLRIQDSVAVQGCGPVGLYSTVLAVEGGASQVIVIGAPSLRLDLAKKWGATDVINIEEMPDPAERKEKILNLTGGRGPDVVVEASGVLAAFKEGLEMVRRGGRYLVIGQTSMEAEIPIVPGIIMQKHLQIIGNASATIDHYYKALQLIQNRREKYPFAEIVTNKYKLEQINEAVAAMKRGQEIKPVIIP
jgi:threonine dehydrogenase-like Zn-dependent dehydrogenase